MAKRSTGSRKRNPLVFAAARAIGGAIAKKGAKAVAKKAVKSKAKSTAKKATAKSATKKKTSHSSLEKTLRSENRGDARTKANIDRLRKQEESGLISAGERHRALNRMTKANKAARARTGTKVSGIKRDTRTSKR